MWHRMNRKLSDARLKKDKNGEAVAHSTTTVLIVINVSGAFLESERSGNDVTPRTPVPEWLARRCGGELFLNLSLFHTRSLNCVATFRPKRGHRWAGHIVDRESA
jgi:hypothetical protein